MAGSELAGVVTREGERHHVTLQGKRLNLEPFELDRGLGTMQFAYEADFKIERVHTRIGVEIADAAGRIRGDGGIIRELSATGEVVGGGPVRIEIGPHNGKQRLRARSDQPGPLLEALGVVEQAASRGGRVTLIIDLVDGRLGETFDGRVYARDFKVTRAPALARVLSVASLDGIANMLRGEGLEFKRARIPFHWSKTAIELHDALAIGAIGLTASGVIDRADRRLDLRGRVIPSYTLNSALGKLPFIGEYLVGGKDEGIFGIDYSVKGSLDNPDVSVNPLSALAPGALRKMFVDPFKSDPDSSAAAPENGAGP
jgi:hypothetical protein